MSSGRITVADDDGQLYLCHQCEGTVLITPSPFGNVTCPICNSGFVEAFTNPTQIQSILSDNPDGVADHITDLTNNDLLSFPPSRPSASPSFSTFDSERPGIRLPSSDGFESSAGMDILDDFDLQPYLFSDLAERQARGGNSEFVFQDHDDGSSLSSPTNTGDYFNEPGIEELSENEPIPHGTPPDSRRAVERMPDVVVDEEIGFSLPTNTGDYFNGPEFDQLIEQLSENDPIPRGTPPASRRAVEGIPDVVVDEEMLNSELAQCAVCKDDFELGAVVKQIPCKHAYHNDCILPWLELHSSCPVCRYELPTDDPDYENQRGRNPGGSPQGPIRSVIQFISLPFRWLLKC